MSQARPSTSEGTEAEVQISEAAPPDSEGAKLESFLPKPDAVTKPVGPPPLTGLRTARIVMVQRGSADILFAGETSPRRADIEVDVDPEVVQEAFEVGDRVLCEPDELGNPVIVGVVRSRKPDTVRISARKIEIEGEEELLLRSGKGALRLREDGDIELVGSRISAASRGLFRLVGKMLRLN